jgi:hypothetical protein
MSYSLTATCHCGAVRLTFPADATGVLACHCGDCQKLHGNFNAFVAVPRADVTLAGTDALVWYHASSESRRAFCGTCGARAVKEQTAAGRWLISAGLIDGLSGKAIIRNLWAQSKPDWYSLPQVQE